MILCINLLYIMFFNLFLECFINIINIFHTNVVFSCSEG